MGAQSQDLSKVALLIRVFGGACRRLVDCRVIDLRIGCEPFWSGVFDGRSVAHTYTPNWFSVYKCSDRIISVFILCCDFGFLVAHEK